MHTSQEHAEHELKKLTFDEMWLIFLLILAECACEMNAKTAFYTVIMQIHKFCFSATQVRFTNYFTKNTDRKESVFELFIYL